MEYIADFESSTKEEEVIKNPIYLGAIMSFDRKVKQIFKNIDDFMIFILKRAKREGMVIYFHNLKWDGEFLIHWLINSYLIYQSEGKLGKNTWNYSKDIMGTMFKISVKISQKYNLVFQCSLNLLRDSVKNIGKTLGIEKKEIDYAKYDFIDGKVPKELEEYIWRDLEIPLVALLKFKKIYDLGLTIATTSKMNYKRHIKKFSLYFGGWYFQKKYEHLTKEQWDYYKKAYHGGFTNYRKGIENVLIEQKLYYYDVNSLYPHIMESNKLPYGKPLYYRPKGSYVVLLNILIFDAKLKEGFHPIIHFKEMGKKIHYASNVRNHYCLYTQREFNLIKKSYIIDYKIIDHHYFKTKNFFKAYIGELKYLKESTPRESYEYQIHKLIMNCLYGKFGENYKRYNKILVPKKEGDQRLLYKDATIYGNNYVEEVKESISNQLSYIPIALFITSFARCFIIEKIIQYRKNVFYWDTDSIVMNTKLEDKYIDDNKFGFWKMEGIEISKFKVLRRKCYLLEYKDKTRHMKLSGYYGKEPLDFDDFKRGTELYALRKKRIKGGAILENRVFKI